MKLKTEIDPKEISAWAGRTLQTVLPLTKNGEHRAAVERQVIDDYRHAMNAAFQAGIEFGQRNPTNDQP